MAACAAFIIVASTTNNYLNRPQEEKEQQWLNIRQQKKRICLPCYVKKHPVNFDIL